MSNLLKNCPTYVINLTERNDKKKYIEKLFNKQKIKFEFYRPIKNESNPRKGCLESHLHLIKNAIKNNYEKILIFDITNLSLANNASLNFSLFIIKTKRPIKIA